MGLLSELKLPAQPAPIQPQRVMEITDTQGAETTKAGVRPIAVKSEPADVKARLDARDQQLRAAYTKLAGLQEKLEAEIPQRNGDTKTAMETQKGDVDKAIGNIDRQLKQLDADRKAVNNPATDAKTMNDIAARAKLPEPIGKAVEVDRHDDPVEKTSPLKKQTTTTTTEVKDGKSTTQVSDEKKSLGLDGAKRVRTDSSETVAPGSRTASSTTRTDSVDLDGYGRSKTTKNESDIGGQKHSSEDTKTTKVGAGGVSRSRDTKSTAADGSSSSSKTSVGGERGDGKAGGAVSGSSTNTDADGASTTKGGSAKAGVSAGKDGIGAYGDAQGSVEHTGKGGLTGGAVLNLNPRVNCNITVKPGDPPMYVLATRIDLGASLTLSASRGGKEDSPGKMGVKASASGNVYMERKRTLGEAEAKAYVAALKSGSGSQEEMTIIRTGLSGGNGWQKAQELYNAMSGKTGSAADVDRMEAGESREVGSSHKKGASASVDLKGVGVDVGVEYGHEESMKVTKGKDGTATYETKTGDSESASRGGKIGVGLAEGGFTSSKSVTTSTGFKLEVKPGMENAAALKDQISKLKTQKQIDDFAAAHKECVVERTDTKGTGHKEGASIGALGVKAGVAYGGSVEESTTVDAEGKTIGTQVKGKNSGAFALSAGGLTVGDSSEEEAVSNTDAEGNTTLDVSRSDKSTNAAKFLTAHVPGMGDKPDKSKGALATATGAKDEPDTDDHDVATLKLSSANLKWMAQVAGTDMKGWMKNCSDPQHRDAWREVANETRRNGGGEKALADALARFMKEPMRERFVTGMARPAGDVSTGTKAEYPDSLTKSRPDYEALVEKACEKDVEKAIKDGDAGKAKALGTDYASRLERVFAAVNSATDFKEPAVRGEMLSAIGRRQSKLQAAMRVADGADPAAAGKAQERADYERLLDLCIRHQQNQNGCFDKIEAEYHKRWSKEDAVVIGTLIRQIRNLHATWNKDYDDLARFAQDNGWEESYWKYKPDRARFEQSIKGHPGAPSEAKRETADKRTKAEPVVSDGASARMNRDEGAATYKKYNAAKAALNASRTKAQNLGKSLKDRLAKNPSPKALALAKQAEQLFNSADGRVKQFRRDQEYMDDMWDYGLPATDEFNQAADLLAQVDKLLPK